MGRELKRVPMDFNWPIGKVWDGYLNPHGKPCPGADTTCFSGYTAAGKWLESISRLIGLIGGQAVEAPRAEAMQARGMIYPHPYLEEWSQAPRYSIPDSVHAEIRKEPDQHKRFAMLDRWYRENPRHLLPMTDELAQFVKALAEREPTPLGSFDYYHIYRKLLDAAGLDNDTWGVCPICHGEGIDPASKAEHDAWAETEPPVGEGYQLWETTSEGSPASPVFATLDELCAWCEVNATTFGSNKTSAEEWKRMLGDGFVCHVEGNVCFM